MRPAALGPDPTSWELLEQWYELAAPNLSPRTASVYRWMIDHYIAPNVGKVRLSGLRSSDLDVRYATLRQRSGQSRAAVS